LAESTKKLINNTLLPRYMIYWSLNEIQQSNRES
jgi:hypothetical protein